MTPSSSAELIWREMHWPRPLDTDLALGLLRRLAADSSRAPVIWETRGDEGVISHFVATAAHGIRELTTAIESQVAGASTSAVQDEQRTPASKATRLAVRGPALPIDMSRSTQASRAILGALSSARFKGEHALIQVVLGSGLRPQATSAKPLDPLQSWPSLLAYGARVASTEIAARVKDKRSESAFEVVIRVAAAAESDARREAILRSVLAALRTVQAVGVQLDYARQDVAAVNEGLLPRRLPLVLSSSEVLSLLGWPLEAEDLPGMPPAHPRVLPFRAKGTNASRVFAVTSAPGTKHALGIAAEAALFHTVAIGPTGSGKSTALLNLISADLEAGRSIVVIDPKSDLVHDVLERVPGKRVDDIVVLDPTDELPVGLNPLLASSHTSPELVADGILNIFRELFPTAFGPRTSDVLHASLLTLASHPGATLTWLPRLLTDARFRAGIIGRQRSDVELASFWAQYNAMSERQQQQHVGPALSRLRQFLLRPSLRRVLDQSEPRFQLESIFTSGRVLLVPLNTGLLGNDAARLLGSLLVGQLWQLSLARTSVPAADRKPVSIYIDEAQEFLRLGGDLADALARSRSLGVAWHVAHQYRDQLPAEMRSAVDANARNKIVFVLGIKDAREMANMAPELVAEDFMALPKHEVYVNLMRDGEQTGWTSGVTLPPPPPISDPAALLARSRERYGATNPDSPAPADSGAEGDGERPLAEDSASPASTFPAADRTARMGNGSPSANPTDSPSDAPIGRRPRSAP